MSRRGKLLLTIALLSALGAAGLLYALQVWHVWMWVPIGITLTSLLGLLAVDASYFKEILLMRTTKHGLNMGALIVLVFVGLGAVNFVAYRNNKKWDLSESKLNSLSDQSQTVVQGLTDDLELKAFFRRGQAEDDRQRLVFEDSIRLYEEASKKVRVTYVDPQVRPDLAKENGVEIAGEVVLNYKGKKNTITAYTEEAITNAIIKITRDRNKVIYFLTGHGEPDINSDKEEGANRFRDVLVQNGYEVKTLNFAQTQMVPKDADVVVVPGGTQPLLAGEIDMVKKFIFDGGRVLLTQDPGSRSNVAELMRFAGVHFTNQYMIDHLGRLLAGNPYLALGVLFSPQSEVTKKIPAQTSTLFQMASALEKAPDARADMVYEELIRSSPQSFIRREMGGNLQPQAGEEMKPRALMAFAEGSATLAGKTSEKRYTAVVIADTDILRNLMFEQQMNRDVIMNSVAVLSKDQDLVSIRPKQAKGQKLNISQAELSAANWGVFLPLPLVLVVLAFVTWYRRRGA